MNRRSRFCRPMPYHLAMSPRKFVLERETGFEPATSTLARLHSTTELLPRGVKMYIGESSAPVNRKSQRKEKKFSSGKCACPVLVRRKKGRNSVLCSGLGVRFRQAYSALFSVALSASSSAASFFSSSSRRARRSTLPTRVLGSSSRNSKTRGTL